MEELRELMETEVEQSPLLQDLLERARTRGQSLISYHGVVFAITAIEDLTHTFSPDELKEFASDFAAADDRANHLTVDQAEARYKQQVPDHG